MCIAEYPSTVNASLLSFFYKPVCFGPLQSVKDATAGHNLLWSSEHNVVTTLIVFVIIIRTAVPLQVLVILQETFGKGSWVTSRTHSN